MCYQVPTGSEDVRAKEYKPRGEGCESGLLQRGEDAPIRHTLNYQGHSQTRAQEDV